MWCNGTCEHTTSQNLHKAAALTHTIHNTHRTTSLFLFCPRSKVSLLSLLLLCHICLSSVCSLLLHTPHTRGCSLCSSPMVLLSSSIQRFGKEIRNMILRILVSGNVIPSGRQPPVLVACVVTRALPSLHAAPLYTRGSDSGVYGRVQVRTRGSSQSFVSLLSTSVWSLEALQLDVSFVLKTVDC